MARHLALGLLRLVRAGGGPLNIRTLGLNRTEWDNFQKLRYWGLVEKAKDASGRTGGVWRATEHGKAFAAGQVAIPKYAVTFRGQTQRLSGESVQWRDLVDEVWDAGEFARRAEAGG